jgi:hypothetical protein
VNRIEINDDVEEHLRVNDLSPEDVSTASLTGSLGARPAEVADVLDDLAADAPLSEDDIRDHYRLVRDIYDERLSRRELGRPNRRCDR